MCTLYRVPASMRVQLKAPAGTRVKVLGTGTWYFVPNTRKRVLLRKHMVPGVYTIPVVPASMRELLQWLLEEFVQKHLVPCT